MRSEDATRTKMGATYIKYKTDAGHQHLKPEEREQEFLEEENYMADSEDLSGTDQYVRTHKLEIRQKVIEMIDQLDQLLQSMIYRYEQQNYSIKDIPDADHQHLQSQDREQEFVEEENFMADTAKLDQIDQDFSRDLQDLQEKQKILEDIWTREQDIQKRKNKLDQMYQDLLTREQDIQKRKNKLDQMYQDLLTREQDIQKRKNKLDQMYQDLLTREQDIQKRKKILEDIRTLEHGIQKRESKLDQMYQDLLTRQQDIQKRENMFDQIYQDLLTCEHERFQKREDKTTKTTNSRHSTILVSMLTCGYFTLPADNSLFQRSGRTSGLLGSVFFASRICSVGADFIPVESDLSLCKTDLSKLADTCDHDEGNAIHCVLNDKGELGIGCFLKTWVKQGYCPYFRNSFGILDIRPCLGNSSICPRDQYLSNEVYKYPGCLINNSTRVLDILTTQTTQSTTVRSSDAGDEESMLPILVVILGLLSFSLLLVLGLSLVFRRKKITSRGLRSAYAPAFMGHQDPQGGGVDI